MPISRKYLGDLETPLSVYLKVSDFLTLFFLSQLLGESGLAVTRLLGCLLKKK